MASTRNINTPSDYCLEQQQYRNNIKYMEYQYSQAGQAYQPAFPAAGSAPPSHMSRDNLSGNPVTIESQLFGIGSTNLVTPYKTVCPQFKHLPEIKFFERNAVIMPVPLIIDHGQRPFPTAGR